VNRRLSALAVAATVVLAACGQSAPPARELALEMVDTLDVSDEVKVCMRDRVERFSLSEQDAQSFSDFQDVAQKANEGNERALQILSDFENTLASCN
jgi:hypothetical protein